MNNVGKNILCISVMQSWGGGEEFLLNLCKNVKEYNFFIASPEGKSFEIFKENNLRVIPIKRLQKIYRTKQKWTVISKAKILFNVILSAFSLIRIIKSRNINLILANGNFAGFYALPIKIFTRKKFIIIQHLVYNENSIEGKILDVLIKYSDKFVCVSNAVRENIRDCLRDSSNRDLIVIHNGIDIPEDIEIRRPNEIRIGMVGSIIRIKGIDLVLEALKGLLLQDDKIKFYIYGDITPEPDSMNYKSELKQFIELNYITNKVFFCGHVNSKDELYSNLHIVVNFTTIPEAFPSSILEAMSYKKIVIAQDEGGPKEIIKDSINGLLIEKANKPQLKEIINYCIEHFYSEELNEIKNNARKTILENYSLESFSRKYKELFDQLISRDI